MYSFLSDFDSFTIKNQVRRQIFSLLGNNGKTLFQGETTLYIHLPWYKRFEKAVHEFWDTPYKRILGYMMILLSLVMISPPDTSFAAEDTEQTFIVTAYYSPLPDQSFYFKGNYNAEKRLNGNGTNGASGTPVFTGMIAAPKSYSFGTHIFFPGLGVGRVEDRGGAIVEAWDRGQPHDRIDIWMGYGEEGLRRSLAWGRREVTGYFITPEAAMNLGEIDLVGIDKGRVNLSNFPSVKSSGVGTISADVMSAFADLGYLPIEGNVKDMIIQYQLDHQIISKKTDDGAGNFGPKTRASLAEQHGKYRTIQDIELKIIEENKKVLLSERDLWEQRAQIIEGKVSAIGSPKRGEAGNHVATLQEVLIETGFLSGKNTGVMTGSTILALKRYQKAHGIRPTGKIDAATKSKLVEDFLEEVG